MASVNGVNSPAPVANVPAPPPPPEQSGVGPSSKTELSQSAQLLENLRELSKSDPLKFSAVTKTIADSIKDAAKQTSGPEADFLNKLSTMFESASQTGALPERKSAPPPPPESQQVQAQSQAVAAYAQQAQAQRVDVGAILQQALQDQGIVVL